MPLINVTLELSHLGTHETFFYSFLPPSVGNKHVHISHLTLSSQRQNIMFNFAPKL